MLYEDSLDKEYPAKQKRFASRRRYHQTDRVTFLQRLYLTLKSVKRYGVLIVLLYDSEGNFKEIVYEVGVR